MKNQNRVAAWIKQAKDDVKWAQDSLKDHHFAQTCFISQQIAEKALKGYAFFLGHDLVKSHSLVKISKELNINGEILNASHRLDLYYISTRYPDALPDSGAPCDYFSKEQADEALILAKRVLELVEQNILVKEN